MNKKFPKEPERREDPRLLKFKLSKKSTRDHHAKQKNQVFMNEVLNTRSRVDKRKAINPM